ncbi:signal peptidase I [Pseudothauera rhizosphaerae]|uniref:Signal peptidase I n=1 Tax=Pseudothauera rhizosphaerae TaxID=2565932 RepID=A0A4S4AK19_9RHOO|nr:signal peptidase I [Pseudothauera rhizosphaerae]THF58673.1 signal peptidase I [Pseudothauera rhizosphaerae]
MLLKMIGAILATIFVVLGCEKTFVMVSSSMEPTIPMGSRVKVDLRAYREASPERFDIVAFRPPLDEKNVFLFRVLALPGEHLLLEGSRLIVDGNAVPGPGSIVYSPYASGLKARYNGITLGADEFYLAGDNVAAANDSRFLGPIRRAEIIGKVTSIQRKQ